MDLKAILRSMRSSVSRIERVAIKLLVMTAEEKRTLQNRAVGVAACAAAAAYGVPQISAHVALEKQDMAFRADAKALVLALNEESSEDLQPVDLNKPWRANVRYSQAKSVSPSSFANISHNDDALSSDVINVLADLAPKKPSEARRQRMEQACMAEAIYYEARSERLEGQIAVAEVVQNRVASRHYPNSVCEVVYEGAHRRTGCQFSFTCDGSMNRTPRGESWERAKLVAGYALMGLHDDKVTGRATHYHTNYVSPYWRVNLVKTKTIGTHIFYRFPERGEWRMIRARQTQKLKAIKPVQDVSLTTEQLMERELKRLDKDV